MSKTIYTVDQQLAIDTRKGEILVSAAAGSGKTAVLIERILQLIIEDNVKITEIVVLTFTNAAAAQMKERLRQKLTSFMQSASITLAQRELAQEQLLFLPLAHISTFHAFCIRMLKNYYQYVGISPNFGIADEADMALLKEEVLEELFEQNLSEENVAFKLLTDTFVTTTNIRTLKKLILDAYEKTRAYPHPTKWLEDAAGWYSSEDKIAQLLVYYTEYITEKLHTLREELTTAVDYMVGSSQHAEVMIELDIVFADIIRTLSKNLQLGLDMLSEVSFDKWPAIKKDDKTLETEAAHGIYKSASATIKTLQSELYSVAEISIQQTENAPTVLALFEMVEYFTQKFSARKNQKELLDFSDIEYKMIELLEMHPLIRSDISNGIVEMLVDEYQDTNETQDTILYYLKNASNRLFMVGDVKQSIYRFRLADPTIFMEKEQNFVTKNQEVIQLNNNFRSREAVLESINALCFQLFKLDIVYDDSIALKYKNKGYNSEQDVVTTLHYYAKDEDGVHTFNNQSESQAEIVYNTIISMLETQEILDLKMQVYRPIQLSDIAILHRNRSSELIDGLQKLFEMHGLAYTSAANTGYFDAIEVKNILSLLNVLDNPYRTIELVAYMRSPLASFTDGDLVEIRHHPDNIKEKSEFYTYIQRYILAEVGSPLAIRLETMLIQLAAYRNKVAVLPLSKVLQFILDESSYITFVATLPNGAVRQANLQMLIELAQRREEYGFMSLRIFIRYMTNLQQNNKDFAIAQQTESDLDAIQMMTIHGSKGLEFPIVLLIDMDKNFNTLDAKGLFQMSKNDGFALRKTDVISRTRVRTWHYDYIANKQSQEDAGEQLRVLYVALTRAEQALHIFMDEGKESDIVETYLSKPAVLGGKSFAEWIRSAVDVVAATRSHADFQQLFQIKTHYLGAVHAQPYTQKVKRNPIQQLSIERVMSIQEQLKYVYPGLGFQAYQQKQTVTEIKRKLDIQSDYQSTSTLQAIEQPMLSLQKPQFMQGSTALSPLEKGTLYHFVLQQYDFTEMLEVAPFLHNLKEQNFITTLELETIDVQKITKIIYAVRKDYLDLGYSIVGKELAFSMTEDASFIYPEFAKFTGEQVAIQGKIDLLLRKDNHFIIVDYKTDNIKGVDIVKQLQARYKVQLAYYTKAVENFYPGATVASKIYAIM